MEEAKLCCLCLDSRLWKSCDALVLWQDFLSGNLNFKRDFSTTSNEAETAQHGVWCVQGKKSEEECGLELV
ncbi:hypothetical protein RJT34_32707 [Clitoria ternatea]|uniref:Uncharacterized protein n=1 Tax=Clitoria ternatea TaxID=43366 RepID=A0AAN9I9S2_CLITE